MIEIDFLCVVVGQDCNLKCRDCGAMAPYAPREIKRYDIEKIILDIKSILRFANIKMLQIQGGEPFLHPDIQRLLDFIGAEERIIQTQIATNGTIIPKPEVIKAIKDGGALVRISNYPVVKNKGRETYEYLKANGVNTDFYEFSSEQGLWYYKGIYEKECDSDDADVNERFWRCKNNVCLTLERNTLSYCTRAVNAHIIQGFDASADDFLVVSDDVCFEKEFVDYLANKHFMEACRYCYGTDENHLVEPAIQIIRTE